LPQRDLRPVRSQSTVTPLALIGAALADGKLKGSEKLPARATVTLGVIGFSHEVKGEIELE
jgi:uncharacterized protein DUF6494